MRRVDKRRNVDIKKEIEAKSVKYYLKYKKLTRFGNLVRMHEERQVKNIREARQIGRDGTKILRQTWDISVEFMLTKKGRSWKSGVKPKKRHMIG